VLRLAPPFDRDLLLDIAADVLATDPLLPAVRAALDGWPLAIELFAAQAVGLGGLDLPWRLWRDRLRTLGARSGGEADPLAVSLSTSLDSPLLRLSPPLPADGARRLYALLGRLPDGLARRDAEVLLPGCGDATLACLLRTRLARLDADRARMLAPVREHAAEIPLVAADGQALLAHYLALASELHRYVAGDSRGIELARLRAELVNLEALIGAALDPAAAPEAAEAQRALGILSLNLGDVRRELGQLALASSNYSHSQAVFVALAAADSGNAQWQRDLSVSWERLATVGERQKDRVGALEAWRQALSISECLATSFPDSVDMQTTSVIHLAGIARNLDHADPSARAEALAALDHALRLLRPLAEAGRLDADRQGWIAWIESQRAALETATTP
jgi:tetratricopeptide (TPR) repeat protein